MHVRNVRLADASQSALSHWILWDFHRRQLDVESGRLSDEVEDHLKEEDTSLVTHTHDVQRNLTLGEETTEKGLSEVRP